MQRPPTEQSHEFRVKPQIQTLHVHVAAGVFSETLNYSEGAKVRKEFSCLGAKISALSAYLGDLCVKFNSNAEIRRDTQRAAEETLVRADQGIR